MDKAERIALADELMSKGVTLVPDSPQGDTAPAAPSEEPKGETATAPTSAQPVETSGSEVSDATTTPAAPAVDVPSWLPESAREAWVASPALRDAFQAKFNNLMSGANEQFMKASAMKDEAKDAIAFVSSLRSDPAKWEAVQRIVTPPAEPADPLKATLAEQFGQDGAETIIKVASQIAEAKAGAVVHARVDGPALHRQHVDEAAAALRQRLGTQVSDEQWNAARANVAVSLGYTAESPLTPYASLTPDNVQSYLLTALTSLTQQQAKSAPPSPPKPQAAKPASVKSSGMSSVQTPRKEGRPTYADTLARAGITDAQVAEWIRNH